LKNWNQADAARNLPEGRISGTFLPVGKFLGLADLTLQWPYEAMHILRERVPSLAGASNLSFASPSYLRELTCDQV
jgi:hypothetical protein